MEKTTTVLVRDIAGNTLARLEVKGTWSVACSEAPVGSFGGSIVLTIAPQDNTR